MSIGHVQIGVGKGALTQSGLGQITMFISLDCGSVTRSQGRKMRLNFDGISFSGTILCQATILPIALSQNKVGKRFSTGNASAKPL
jgi:hypothetical protein